MHKARFGNTRLPGGPAAMITLVFPVPAATAEVAGTVRFQGKPLSRGRITFTRVGSPGVVGYSWIRPDGTYQVSDCPVGPVKVTVQTVFSPARRTPPSTATSVGGKPGVPLIPGRYSNPATTDLNCSVSRGKQTFDVELRA